MDRLVDVFYIFSRNKKIGSLIIRKGTAFLVPDIKTPPSHAAILIDNRWVVESTLDSGFRVIPYSQWLEINEELFKIKCNKSWTMTKIKELYKPLKNKKYDFKGVLYFTWRLVLLRLFGIKRPTENKYDHDDKYFCCEVISKMTGVSYEMTAPVELVYKISHALEEFKD